MLECKLRDTYEESKLYSGASCGTHMRRASCGGSKFWLPPHDRILVSGSTNPRSQGGPWVGGSSPRWGKPRRPLGPGCGSGSGPPRSAVGSETACAIEECALRGQVVRLCRCPAGHLASWPASSWGGGSSPPLRRGRLNIRPRD